jgi:phosphoribosylformylglycinamidine cyclo-ligase
VNDIAGTGAEPLFFLDYFAVGKLDADVASTVFSGIARGCRNNGCALIGGETAEMPGMYSDGEYDLMGFIVGAAERTKVLTGRKIAKGDILLGLPSTGLHTNGYSLARKLLFDVAEFGPHTYVPELQSTLADELLKVHRSYLKPIRKLLAAGILKGAAHITGGGITDNTPRILPDSVGIQVELSAPADAADLRIVAASGQYPGGRSATHVQSGDRDDSGGGRERRRAGGKASAPDG